MSIQTVELIVTRGLPASGKSTYAKAWVAINPRRRACVEKDKLRAMMHDSLWLGRHTEDQVNVAQLAMVTTLLGNGISVVISDTNLDVATFGKWRDLAESMGVKFSMEDFREVPLQVCIDRNAKRTGKEFVPVEAIMSMHKRHIIGIHD